VFAVAEAASNKDSIRCRDIRYKNEDLNQSRYVETPSNSAECVLSGVAMVQSTIASDLNSFIYTKPSLTTSLPAISNQSESLPSTLDHSAKMSGTNIVSLT